jgi:TRAP-type C4-dicarboxylate transport system substrate-binding protein
MKDYRCRMARGNRLGMAAGGAVMLLLLSACAGSAGSAESGEGYDYGASQEEVNEVLQELEPVTLTYQPAGSSEASMSSPPGVEFAKAIEEKSNGKITVDIVWGQAIAGFDEVDDALADGRVDLAMTVPAYQPAEYPAVNALGTALAKLPASPFAGELVAEAVSADLAWNSPEIIEEFEAKGIHPIAPVRAGAHYQTECVDKGNGIKDWQGRQVRVGSENHSGLMESLGATPVSLDYTETYEALQRNLLNCQLGAFSSSVESGSLEVAPHVSYTTTTSFARVPSTLVAGSSFDRLPLAYQQVIFDSYADAFHGQMQMVIGNNAEGVRQAKAAGGALEELPAEVQQQIADFNTATVRELAESDALGNNLVDQLAESTEKWTQKVEELGLHDDGSVEDFDQWFNPDTDFRTLGTEIYEEILLEHRPG